MSKLSRCWERVKRIREGEVGKFVGQELMEATERVVGVWIEKGILTRNLERFEREVEEAMVIAMLVQEELEKDTEGETRVLYDVCCGKGYASCLVQGLAGEVGCVFSRIEKIIMLDNETKGAMDMSHLDILNANEALPKMVYVRGNIHDLTVQQNLGIDRTSRGIWVGIHLCRRISVRFLKLFLFLEGMDSMVLAPCCLPNGNDVELNGNTILPCDIKAAEDPFATWCEFLYSSLPAAPPVTKRLIIAPLKGSEHRKSTFLTLSRGTGPERIIPPPPKEFDDPTMCRSHYFKGRCTYPKKCRFIHVEGLWV